MSRQVSRGSAGEYQADAKSVQLYNPLSETLFGLIGFRIQNIYQKSVSATYYVTSLESTEDALQPNSFLFL